jgi:MFS family permease
VVGLAVSLYWPGFRACFAQSLLHKRIGPAVGLASALSLVAFGIAPAIGGAVATHFGIVFLYILSMLCFVAAALPLFTAPEIVRNTDISLKQLNWRRIKKDLLANAGDNIDDSVLCNVWPLFIFLLVPSYLGVGILSSITIIASIIISLYVGRKVRKNSEFLPRGSWLVSLTNSARMFTQSAGHIAGVNFFNGMGHALMLPSYDARYYKNAEQEPVLLYVFAMLMAGAVGCALLFGVLILISLVVPTDIVLAIGLLIAVPAGYTIRLIRA